MGVPPSVSNVKVKLGVVSAVTSSVVASASSLVLKSVVAVSVSGKPPFSNFQ